MQSTIKYYKHGPYDLCSNFLKSYDSFVWRKPTKIIVIIVLYWTVIRIELISCELDQIMNESFKQQILSHNSDIFLAILSLHLIILTFFLRIAWYKLTVLTFFLRIARYKLAVLTFFLRIVRYILTIASYEVLFIKDRYFLRIASLYLIVLTLYLAISSSYFTIESLSHNSEKKLRITSLYLAILALLLAIASLYHTILEKKSELPF